MTYNLTSDGDTEVAINTSRQFTVAASGNFGSGTLKVQYRVNGGWADYESGDTGDFTAAGERVFVQCGDEHRINLNLASSTSPDIDIVVKEVDLNT